MLWLIILGLVFLTGVFILIQCIRYDYGVFLGIFIMVLTWVVGTGASAAILFGILSGGEHDTTTKVTSTQSLQAINTGSSIEGSFFLGSGTVDGKRVINYITQTTDDLGTYSEVKQVEASKARIFEDSDTPRLDMFSTYAQNDFLILGPVRLSTDYHFHIPSGSVLENYTITND